MDTTANAAGPSAVRKSLWDIVNPLTLRTRSGMILWRRRGEELAAEVGRVTVVLSPAEQGVADSETISLRMVRDGEVIDEVDAAGSDPWLAGLRELRSTIQNNRLAADRAIDEIMVTLKAM